MDTWYATKELMLFIESLIKIYYCPLRDNRAVSDIAINLIKPVGTIVSEANWQRRLWGVLFALFAGIALLLAAVDLYDAMSYLVSQRTREIGVRMALGARGVDVWRLIVGQGLKVVALGVAVGIIAAIALARVMTSLLFGITATDPLTYASVALLLASDSIAPSYKTA